jgi:acetyl esterase/lipase
VSQYLAGQPVTPYVAPLAAQDLSGLPPALVLGAGLDSVRDDARRYARRLRQDGVAASYLGTRQPARLSASRALSVAWTAMDDIAAISGFLAADRG